MDKVYIIVVLYNIHSDQKSTIALFCENKIWDNVPTLLHYVVAVPDEINDLCIHIFIYSTIS